MDWTRRKFLAVGAGLLIAGCTQTRSSTQSSTGQAWPHPAPRADGQGQPSPEVARILAESQRRRQTVVGSAESVTQTLPVQAIPRSQWAKGQPIQGRLNPLTGISRITVHHEGWTPFWASDARTTADRLELIRTSHLQRMSAGDIGYHFIIDRAGRLWSGRSMAYQGAHVRNHNEKNLGIMLLGNFDQQTPTEVQLQTLEHTVLSFARAYRVTPYHIRSHQELNPTRCPGTHMQRRMDSLRRTLG